MRKPFMIQLGAAVILGIIAYLLFELQYIPAAGVFGALSALFFISSICHGIFPDDVRKRNGLNIFLDLVIYIPITLVILGGSDGLSVLFNNTPIIDKTVNVIPETHNAVEKIAIEAGKFLRLQPVQFNGFVKWSYVFLLIDLLRRGYKILRSYGWKFMITLTLTIAAVSCYFMFLPSTAKWHAISWAGILFLLGLAACEVKKYWRNPVIT